MLASFVHNTILSVFISSGMSYSAEIEQVFMLQNLPLLKDQNLLLLDHTSSANYDDRGDKSVSIIIDTYAHESPNFQISLTGTERFHILLDIK